MRRNLLALASLTTLALSGCDGEVGGGGICQRAAAHLAACTGKNVVDVSTSCDQTKAEAILATSCGGRSAQAWWDDLCAFLSSLGMNCSGAPNGGLPAGGGAGSCAGQCGSANDVGGCYCNAECVQMGDCCADYAAVCGGGGGVPPAGGGAGSCVGQCGSANDVGGCYCNAECLQFGDCCADYATACP